MSAREPDLKSAFARAWRLELAPQPGDPPDWMASVAHWVLTGPFHPAWSWWMVCAVSLRDIPGVRPAAKHFAEASHEIMIWSLDPGGGPPDLENPRHRPRLLSPPDLVHQVGGLNDDQVRELVKLMVRACVDGWMSPDSDFRERWKKAITRTAQHFALGGHPKESA